MSAGYRLFVPILCPLPYAAAGKSPGGNPTPPRASGQPQRKQTPSPDGARARLPASQMPYFLVRIQGGPARARGLLAIQGIQNIVTDDGEVAARLQADEGKLAVERVQAALAGESFTVGEPEPEGP